MNLRKFIASETFHQFIIYCGCVWLVSAIFLVAGGFDFFLNLGIKKVNIKNYAAPSVIYITLDNISLEFFSFLSYFGSPRVRPFSNYGKPFRSQFT